MSINKSGLDIATDSENTLSLYIHIPFCNSKCSYCSFISMVASENDKKKYFETLIKEIKLQATKYAKFYVVSSIYIGGGTPSCLDQYYIRDLLSCIYKNFSVKNTAEITIEINPNSITREKIREYILSGINRFSIGLQSLSSNILKEMRRTHSPEDFKKTLSIIQDNGIKNISVDIILGYPKQTLNDIKETLDYLIKLGIPHISAYMLQVENNTKLKALVDNGIVGLPSENLVVKMYNYVYKTLKNNGYERYEFSNFARPGYKSYHNQIYWKRKDYLGLGLAAHSYIRGTRFANTENIRDYVISIEKENKIPTSLLKNLTQEEQQEEAVMLSLRTKDGFDTKKYEEEFNENFLIKQKETIKKLIIGKFITLSKDGIISCTDKGFLVLNQIILELLT